jgi:hypothetical protein
LRPRHGCGRRACSSGRPRGSSPCSG